MATTYDTVDRTSVLQQIDDALKSRNHWELKQALYDTINARRSLDCSVPEESALFNQLYQSIGDLKYALEEDKKGSQNKITMLTHQAEQALERNTMGALVAAKQEVKRYLDNGCPENVKASLSSLKKDLISAMDAINDATAFALIERFNAQTKETWEAIDDQNLLRASDRLSVLKRTASQITDPKPFMRFAIDRAEKESGGWEEITGETLKSFAETQRALSDLAMETGKEHTNKAKELASRLEANLQNGNTGAASDALEQLRLASNAAGLAYHLGSIEKRDDFLADAESRLAPKKVEHFKRRLNKLFRRL
jgi:hypothetical protein